ncbi:MAG: phosphatidylglycerol lysyltransferase domain-containing protein [Lachnospiraceae bacterium]|nr:phosphatidylglycerol lysyltransferase domain-containing protein [Lachnospiraceae bacterium]
MSDSKLDFKEVRIEDYDWIYSYTSRYGEGSCQHSPVSMYSLAEKYQDEVCERDGYLFTLRHGLCDDEYRVYLAPLGDAPLARGFEMIMEDAAAYGRKVKFITLTDIARNALEESFPGRFGYVGDRDLSEYIYRAEIMAAFEGSSLRKRRAEVHTFWNQYGDRARIAPIGPEDYEECLAYEEKWTKDNIETHDAFALERDMHVIGKQMAHYKELHLSGIILYVDDVIRGFTYGTKLGDTYDVIVEKADRVIPHSFKVLRQESAKRCATGCTYVNMEEDLGIPGLRALKMAYKPEKLLAKYIVTEK